MLLYKTTTDQNVHTTRHNLIHFVLGFAVWAISSILSISLIILKIRSFCTKKRAVNLVNTQKSYTYSIISLSSRRCHLQSLFAQNYQENTAMDLFSASTFPAVDYATCWIFRHLYGTAWCVTLTPPICFWFSLR